MSSYVVILRDPDGTEMDISDRVTQDGLGSIRETPEEDLTLLTHGDMSLDITDMDGAVENFLRSAAPGESWYVIVYEDTGLRRLKFERVFAGLIDLPWSVQIDRKERTISVQAMGLSKILENASAESVKRTLTGRTADATAGNTSVTVSSTTDFAAGDKMKLTDASKEETQTIKSVDGATTVTMVTAYSQGYSGAAVTIETPYYRRKTVEYLMGLLATAAGISDYQVDLDATLAEYPVTTEMNTDGVTPTTSPRSITIEDGNIRATYSSGNRKEATSPSSGFTDTGVANNSGQGDWTPYLEAEPATILERASNADIGQVAWDHTNGNYYTLVVATSPSSSLTLYTNGVAPGVGDGVVDSYAGTNGYDIKFLEWVPTSGSTGDVWVAYSRGNSTDMVLKRGTDVFSTVTTVANGQGGQLRYIRTIDRVAFQRGSTVDLYDPVSLTVKDSFTQTGIEMWTLRYFDGYVAYIYTNAGVARVRLLDATTFDEVADYAIASGTSANSFATVWTNPDSGIQSYIGWTASTWFVLSREASGIIAYADFEGLSVAAAMRELALASGSILTVDEYGTVSLRGRSSLSSTDPVLTFDDPIERESLPVWEYYRASVAVTGQNEAGTDIEVIAGDSGDSAHRLELTGDLITTEGMAEAVANQMVAFLGAIRSQETVTVRYDGTRVRPFDVVSYNGTKYLVMDIERDLRDAEVEMTLVGVS